MCMTGGAPTKPKYGPCNETHGQPPGTIYITGNTFTTSSTASTIYWSNNATTTTDWPTGMYP